MKSLMLIIMSLMLMQHGCNAQIIGQIQNGNFIITTNISELKQNWEQLLDEQGNSASLTNFAIQSKTKTTGEIYYLLTASNANRDIKIAHQLDLKDNNFTFTVDKQKSGASGPILGGTCTCTGCNDGCEPVLKDDGTFKCSPCSGSSTDCKKSVTVKIPE